jgi:hypothetical protein
MLCHSAGGWLARLYLQDFGTAGFDRLVSLGSPHRPPPEGAQGIVDQTRGILKFCEDNCPGAFHGEVRLRVSGWLVVFLRRLLFLAATSSRRLLFLLLCGHARTCVNALLHADKSLCTLLWRCDA